MTGMYKIGCSFYTTNPVIIRKNNSTNKTKSIETKGFYCQGKIKSSQPLNLESIGLTCPPNYEAGGAS